MKLKQLFMLIIIIMLSLCLFGCQKKSGDNAQNVSDNYDCYAYYINKDRNKLVKEGLDNSLFKDMDDEQKITAMIDILKKPDNPAECIPTIGDDVEINNFTISNNQLIIDFSADYFSLTPDIEILVRSAIVKSLMQLDFIHKISFTVADSVLLDKDNNIIGTMDSNSFVENMGTDINKYTEDTLYLYFADLSSKKLVKTSVKVMRKVNISREKTILDYLFKGPQYDYTNSVLPVIPNDLKINSVITKNGICYIDLTQKNVTSDSSMSGELIIYSIVNSLTEDSNIMKVKISIDSNEAAIYRGVKLDEPFEKNDKYVK